MSDSKSAPVLDDLDHRIIDLLTRDARVSNRQIAAQLGVTEGTIRGRIKRLKEENCIRITAVMNSLNIGAPRTVLIGIQALQPEIQPVSRTIAGMPEIRSVILTLGRFDILAIGLFHSLEDVFEIANNRILALRGVQHVETSVAVETLKYDYRAAKITPLRRSTRSA